VRLLINGKDLEVDVAGDEPLLWVLRDWLGLTGTKFGCGVGTCGACTVHLDGVAVRSCTLPVAAAQGRALTTIEGLETTGAGEAVHLHPVQQAFLDHQVPQCGWCMSGQMMTAAAFLAAHPAPTAEDIDTAMAGNLCRCAAYGRIRLAVAAAARKLEEP
jgi:isoquinoline 1-oxidoreductase subunit alpha